MRAVIYARVSGEDRGSIQTQLEMGREYACRCGYTVTGEYSEEWVSGAAMDAPELQHILELARSGSFDVLIVREMDRLARDLVKQMLVEEQLQKAGVRIEYVLGEYPDTPEGTLNKQIRAVVAEFERQKITERSLRGRIAAAHNGRVLGAVWGLRLPFQGGRRPLEIIEAEANVVRMIYSWYIEGNGNGEPLSSIAIADKLSARDIPTWADTRGILVKHAPHGVWNHRSVMRILHSKTYSGTYTWGEIAVPVPSIVDVDTWAAAQWQCHKNTIKPVNITTADYLLQGRVTCGECGATGYSLTQHNGGHTYTYYRCGDKVKRRRACELPGFSAAAVDRAAWEWITTQILDPDRLQAGLEALRGNPLWDEPTKRRYNDAQQRAVAAAAQLHRLQDLYLLGHLTRDEYLTRRADIEAAEAAAIREQRDIETLCERAEPPTSGDMENAVSFAAAIREELQEVDFETRKRIVALLDTRVHLYADRRVIVDIGLPRFTGRWTNDNFIRKTSNTPRRIRLSTTLTIEPKRKRPR